MANLNGNYSMNQIVDKLFEEIVSTNLLSNLTDNQYCYVCARLTEKLAKEVCDFIVDNKGDSDDK